MSGLTTRFDYGGLPEPEILHGERQAERLTQIREKVAGQAIESGKILLEMQERLANRGNGTFYRWVEDRCGYSTQQARRLMAAAERFKKVCNNVVAKFDQSSLTLLGASSTPEPAFAEALRIAAQGHAVPHKLAKEIVDRHSGKAADGLPAGYSPHGTGKKAGGRKSEPEASVDLDGDTVPVDPPDPQPWPGDDEPDEADAPAFAAPVVVETTAKTVPENVTASDLLPVLSSLNARVKKVAETIDGDPFDGKEAAKHCIVIVDMLTGETPKWRLVKAGDVAGQAAEIFDLYPRKVARDKALVEIRKALRKVSFEELKEAVSEYARSRAGKDEQFTPHPATWFGEGRWADDRRDWFRQEDRGRGTSARAPGAGERFDASRAPVSF